MIKKCYTLGQHGNFYDVRKNGEPITELFDGYDRDDLQKLVNELNSQMEEISELKSEVDFYKVLLMGLEETAKRMSKIR